MPMNENIPAAMCSLDAVLHQPVRTQIVAYLVGRSESTFMELKRVLQMSDGNLESHLKKLIVAEYVISRKDTSGSRQQTLYLLTEAGQAALHSYLGTLHKLLGVPLQDKDAVAEPALAGVLNGGKLAWR